VQVEIARINDRNLIKRVRTDADRYGSADSVGSAEGEPVWSGELLVENVPNQPVVTVGELKPGLYIASAMPAKGTILRDDEDDRIVSTSQWFVVSDLGLTSFVGDHGVLVQVRSLQTAQPIVGVEVALLSRNNKEPRGSRPTRKASHGSIPEWCAARVVTTLPRSMPTVQPASSPS